MKFHSISIKPKKVKEKNRNKQIQEKIVKDK